MTPGRWFPGGVTLGRFRFGRDPSLPLANLSDRALLERHRRVTARILAAWRSGLAPAGALRVLARAAEVDGTRQLFTAGERRELGAGP